MTIYIGAIVVMVACTVLACGAVVVYERIIADLRYRLDEALADADLRYRLDEALADADLATDLFAEAIGRHPSSLPAPSNVRLLKAVD